MEVVGLGAYLIGYLAMAEGLLRAPNVPPPNMLALLPLLINGLF